MGRGGWWLGFTINELPDPSTNPRILSHYSLVHAFFFSRKHHLGSPLGVFNAETCMLCWSGSFLWRRFTDLTAFFYYLEDGVIISIIHVTYSSSVLSMSLRLALRCISFLIGLSCDKD